MEFSKKIFHFILIIDFSFEICISAALNYKNIWKKIEDEPGYLNIPHQKSIIQIINEETLIQVFCERNFEMNRLFRMNLRYFYLRYEAKKCLFKEVIFPLLVE